MVTTDTAFIWANFVLIDACMAEIITGTYMLSTLEFPSVSYLKSVMYVYHSSENCNHWLLVFLQNLCYSTSGTAILKLILGHTIFIIYVHT